MNQAPHTQDPAMTALVELRAAEDALLKTERLVEAESLDNNAPEVEAVRKKDIDALKRFANTKPTTVRGAIVKLQYIAGDRPDSIGGRSISAVIAYLEKMAMDRVKDTDPLSDLWREWGHLENRANSCCTNDTAFKAIQNRQAEIEKNMVDLKPASVEGALALVGLLRNHVCMPEPDESPEARICKNLITGLKRMGAA